MFTNIEGENSMKIKKGYSSIIACIILIFAVALSGTFGLLLPKQQYSTTYAYEIPSVEGDWLTEVINDLPKNSDGSINRIQASNYLTQKPYNTTRNGTKENPLLIMNALDLAYLTYTTLNDSYTTSKYFALGADINLEGKQWIPIGNATDSHRFYGGIDGAKIVDGQVIGNYKIKNLSIIDSNDNYRGLIGYSAGYNEFTNIDFENPFISGIGSYYSVLVGYALGGININNININGGYVYSAYQTYTYIGAVAGLVQTNGKSVNISNVTNNANIETTGNYIGGLVGNIDENGDYREDTNAVNEDIVFTNVVNNGTITGNQIIGGFVGRSEYIEINNSNNFGYIYSSPVASGNYAGGLVGCANYGIKITSSYNKGIVEGYYVGGLVGGLINFRIDSEITDCFNSAMLNGQHVSGAIANYVTLATYNNLLTINNFYNTGELISLGFVGGVIGNANGNITINNSRNERDIISESNLNNAGGLVGRKDINGTIIINNSFNLGDIITPLKDYVGGLIGYAGNNALGGTEIYNSYNIGAIEGRNAGGLVGYITSYIIIEKSFNMGSVSTSSNYAGGLIGYIIVNNSTSRTNIGIFQSYNTGEINAGVTYNAGLIGYLSFSNILTNTTFKISQSFNGGIVQKGTTTNGLISAIQFINDLPDILQRVEINNSFSLNNAREDEIDNILTFLPVNTARTNYVTRNSSGVAEDLREIVVNGVANTPKIEEDVEGEMVTTFTIADYVLSLNQLRNENTFVTYDFINIWAMPEVGSEGNNGAPYLKDIAGLNLTLIIDSVTTIEYNAVLLERVNIIHDLPGQAFIGWATHEDVNHEDYVLYEKGISIPLKNNDVTLYAQYQTILYYHIAVDGFTEGSLAATLKSGDGLDNNIGFALKEDNNTYSLELTTTDPVELNTFTGWQVYNESKGVWYTIASHHVKSLNLKNRIDQDFINQYASLYPTSVIEGEHYTVAGVLRFRAGKTTDTVEVYAISNSSNNGKLKINNFNASFTEGVFTTAPYEGTTVTLKANPNEFYTVGEFNVTYYYNDGVSEQSITYPLTLNDNNEANFDLLILDYNLNKVDVQIEFIKIEYDINIVAKSTDDVDLIVSNLLTINPANSSFLKFDEPASITITANNFFEIKAGERLKFVGYKIWNHINNSYDYILGNDPNDYILNEIISGEFLNNYTDDNTNQLVIIAEYSTEYEVIIASGEGGVLEIVISSASQDLPIIVSDINGWFEKGSIINVTANATTHYLFSDFEGSHNGLIIGNRLEITLNDNVDIIATYTLQLYNVIVQYRNYNTDDKLSEDGEVELSMESVKVGDILTFSNIQSPTGYRFEAFQIRGLGNQLNNIEENSVVINESFLIQFKNHDDEIVVVARYVQQYTINIEMSLDESSMGGYELYENISDNPEVDDYEITSNRKFDIGTKLQIKVITNNFHEFLGFVNVSLSEKDANDVNLLNVRLINNRTITLRFKPIVYEINREETSVSGGTLTVNKESFKVGDQVVIMFTPESGQVIKNWTINGINVNSIENAVVNSNSVTLTITSDWLETHNNNIVNNVSTELNSTILISIIAVGSVIAILAITFIYLFISNARKKVLIRGELKNKEMVKYTMDTSSFIKDLREGKDVGQVTDEQVKEEMKRRKKNKK